MEIEINGTKKQFEPHQTVLENKKCSFLQDFDDVAITRDESKCIACSACRTACLDCNNLGIPVETKVDDCTYYRPDGKEKFADSNCTRCGQCVIACPTGALSEKDNIEDVKKDLTDPEKIVIAQIAPSVRVSVSESFGLPVAQNMEGEMVAALKQLGFDYVFDVNVGADFTTYEEAFDLVDRVKDNEGVMFTSCCPARVKYIEDFHPEFIDHITTVRSPQQCMAVLIKTHFAKKYLPAGRQVSVVSIMPCIAKKFESRREGEDKSGAFDVDWVLTTREFIKMVKEANIDLAKIEPKPLDDMMGDYSGAAAIYGATGGVMESALRTFAFAMGESKIDFEECRGADEIKRFKVKVKDKELKIAIASTLKNAEIIMNEIKNGEKYDYVEVMACPGGCVGGGGQPKPASMDTINKRREALYEIDKAKPVRTAHDSAIVKQVYQEFLHCAGSPEAKKYLHTIYDKGQARICKIKD